MKRTLAAVALMALLAGSAQAQGYNVQTMPLGGGWQHYSGSAPDGSTFTGTQMPLGGGWSNTQLQDSYGRQTICTTMPLGGGFSTTQCQ